jgi:putative transposase
MRDHRAEFRLATMCRVLKVERSGFYAWLKQPQSTRAREDERLLVMIEEAYLASGGVYGARNVHRDLVEAGEQLGRKRVERLMRERGLRSVRTPRKRRYGGKPAAVAPNRLQRRSPSSSRTRRGSPTSRICARPKAGSTLPSCSISTRVP